ncbi:MAG: radical SAM protein [Acutalibacteraceae bacterium]|nr:radical SAM protein [Acutalibacteraceae bacterium]
MRHGNISVFVPHIGCPHRCSFCNQNTITGENVSPKYEDVIQAVKTAAAHPNYNPENTELAFFGGSFTAIPYDYMAELLNAGYEFYKKGIVSGIRISTRPDAINDEILSLLKSKGVRAIELGCQSLNDEVLRLNLRGHTAEDVKKSSLLIKKYGFSLGLQMMTGLYGDTDEFALETAKQIIDFGADTVRIYPTLLLKGTYLYSLYKKGEYAPQTLEQAVELTSKLLMLFEENNVNVIRVGLHTVEKDGFVVGPWHPAFGELCKSRVLIKKVLKIIEDKKIPKGDIFITVPKGKMSAMTGQKRVNIDFLNQIGYNVKITENKNLKEVDVKVC